MERSRIFKKTEKLLYIYPDIRERENEFVDLLRDSLEKLRDEPYYDIIELKYFNKMSHERIAEVLYIDPKTVTRQKNKLINRLSFMLFTDESIKELLNK